MTTRSSIQQCISAASQRHFFTSDIANGMYVTATTTIPNTDDSFGEKFRINGYCGENRAFRRHYHVSKAGMSTYTPRNEWLWNNEMQSKLFAYNRSSFSSAATIMDVDNDTDDNECNDKKGSHYEDENNESTFSTGNGGDRHCRTCTCHDTNANNDTTPSKYSKSNEQPAQHVFSGYEHQSPIQQSADSITYQQKNSDTTHHSNIHHQSSTIITQTKKCHLSTPLLPPNTPLPPPHPQPSFSFYKRNLPQNLIAFTSAEGKRRFAHALQTNHAESYFPLSEQFLTQMDPAYCGVSTLVLILNALAMDPNVRWRGGWRWYGNESMLLERCCLEEERVRREGVTIEEFGGLARCQGVDLIVKRPVPLDDGCDEGMNDGSDGSVGGMDERRKSSYQKGSHGIDEFRRDIIASVQMPPRTRWDDGEEASIHELSQQAMQKISQTRIDANAGATASGGYFLVTSFARHSLKQTGDGHFSPIAAYHPPTDSCLVLDVARFKYTPYWVAVTDLYEAMIPADMATGKSRGWILMFPPPTDVAGGRSGNEVQHRKTLRTVEEREGKR